MVIEEAGGEFVAQTSSREVVTPWCRNLAA
jgi:hypothetical protein